MREWVRESVRSMEGYVPGEQPRVEGLIKLNTNENPYPPSPKAARALAETMSDRLRLYPDPLCGAVRARIGAMHGCETSRVFVGNGSDEVLALCTRAFVERGRSIGFFNPSYSLYPVLAAIQDVPARAVELAADFGWPMDGGPLASSSVLADCSLFFLTNPNAPTGIRYPKTQVRAFCERFQGVVLIDEAYVDFAEDDAMDLALELDNVMVARSLSKSYSLAGLRAGYAVGATGLIDALFKLKDSYNISSISQALALAALSDVEGMRANVERIKATRRRLSRALSDLGFMVCPSETNFVWTKPSAMEARELFERLRERRILVRYFPGVRTGEFVRITVGTDREIDSLIEATRAIVRRGDAR